MHENRETSETPAAQPGRRSAGEGLSHKARAYDYEESHSGILPMNHSNKDGTSPAESGEERPLIKENDLWVNVWRKKWAHGEVAVILGFQHQTDADRFLENLRERLGMFGLELHPDKTRRIEFGRFAEQNRERRGEGKPETFDFLGLTHISGKNRLGRFTVRRKTIRKRFANACGRSC